MALINCDEQPGAVWHFEKTSGCSHANTKRVHVGDTAEDRLFGLQCKDCKAILY